MSGAFLFTSSSSSFSGCGGGEDGEEAVTAAEEDVILKLSSRDKDEDRNVDGFLELLLLLFRGTGDMATAGNEWENANLSGLVKWLRLTLW